VEDCGWTDQQRDLVSADGEQLLHLMLLSQPNFRTQISEGRFGDHRLVEAIHKFDVLLTTISIHCGHTYLTGRRRFSAGC
jgi:hypothetical protein